MTSREPKKSSKLNKSDSSIVQESANETTKLEHDLFELSNTIIPKYSNNTLNNIDNVTSLIDVLETSLNTVSSADDPINLDLFLQPPHKILKTEDSHYIPFSPSALSPSGTFSPPPLGSSPNGSESSTTSFHTCKDFFTDCLGSGPGSPWLSFSVQFRKLTNLHVRKHVRSAEQRRRINPSTPSKDYYVTTLREEVDMDLYGYSPMEDQLILVKCNHCTKTVKASRFNHHISHCLRTEATETVVRVKTETAPPVVPPPPEQTQSSPSKSSSTKRKPATSATANESKPVLKKVKEEIEPKVTVKPPETLPGTNGNSSVALRTKDGRQIVLPAGVLASLESNESPKKKRTKSNPDKNKDGESKKKKKKEKEKKSSKANSAAPTTAPAPAPPPIPPPLHGLPTDPSSSILKGIPPEILTTTATTKAQPSKPAKKKKSKAKESTVPATETAKAENGNGNAPVTIAHTVPPPPRAGSGPTQPNFLGHLANGNIVFNSNVFLNNIQLTQPMNPGLSFQTDQQQQVAYHGSVPDGNASGKLPMATQYTVPIPISSLPANGTFIPSPQSANHLAVPSGPGSSPASPGSTPPTPQGNSLGVNSGVNSSNQQQNNKSKKKKKTTTQMGQQQGQQIQTINNINLNNNLINLNNISNNTINLNSNYQQQINQQLSQQQFAQNYQRQFFNLQPGQPLPAQLAGQIAYIVPQQLIPGQPLQITPGQPITIQLYQQITPEQLQQLQQQQQQQLQQSNGQQQQQQIQIVQQQINNNTINNNNNNINNNNNNNSNNNNNNINGGTIQNQMANSVVSPRNGNFAPIQVNVGNNRRPIEIHTYVPTAAPTAQVYHITPNGLVPQNNSKGHYNYPATPPSGDKEAKQPGTPKAKQPTPTILTVPSPVIVNGAAIPGAGPVIQTVPQTPTGNGQSKPEWFRLAKSATIIQQFPQGAPMTAPKGSGKATGAPAGSGGQSPANPTVVVNKSVNNASSPS